MKYGYELLEDRYYSDYDYEDALYERAFSEGYEYAQREFAKKIDYNKVYKKLHLNNTTTNRNLRPLEDGSMRPGAIGVLKRDDVPVVLQNGYPMNIKRTVRESRNVYDGNMPSVINKIAGKDPRSSFNI